MDRLSSHALASALAQAFIAGPMDATEMTARGEQLIGKKGRWLRQLAERFHHAFSAKPRPRVQVAQRFIYRDAGFRAACSKYKISIVDRTTTKPEMRPIVGFPADLEVTKLSTPSELCNWLELSYRELFWFADRFGFERKSTRCRARRYRYRVLSKGSRRFRLIEAPTRRLREIQRRVLREILAVVPAHQAAHGFVAAKSIFSFVQPHIGKSIVLKMDLTDFFPSIRLSRVSALFRSIGYPEVVADLLTGLCSNSVPDDVWCADAGEFSQSEPARARRVYDFPHLPQGAPTSPAIANLCAYRLDCRLTALAAATGAAYTRYADDLAFSGGETFARSVRRFRDHAAAIVMDEGFIVNYHKTRVMSKSQRQSLAGILVNQRTNITRHEYDHLKALLHNCVKHGPDSQNRARHPHFRGYLQGKISFVTSVHSGRDARLREIFDTIQW